jgi:hypothetical protein
MKFSQILRSASIAAVIDHALAYPGIGAKFAETSNLVKRNNPVGANIPLGDLLGGPRTTTGKTATNCLADTIDCHLTTPKVGPTL